MKSKKHNSLADWLIGAAAASVLLTLIVLFGDLRFAVNDDSVMLRPLMGFDSTAIPDFHLYLHTIIAYPLRWLSMAVPHTPWYSYMLIAFNWLACAVSVKCMSALFAQRGHSRAWGAVLGLLYAALFCMVYSCRVTYTVTAAMLGAAAVLQVLSAELEREDRINRSLLFTLVPLALSYSLRQITVLPIAAFCLLALAYKVMAARGKFGLSKAVKPALTFLAAAAVLFGVLAGGRELEIKLKHKEDYLRWQRARIEVMDYYNLSELTDGDLADIGWSRAEQQLVSLWYFMDDNITAEAFETIAQKLDARNPRSMGDKLSSAFELIGRLYSSEPVARRSLYPVAALAALCALALIFKRRGSLWQWLCMLAGAGLAAVMLIYLGMEGRLPLRAALTVIMPFAALIFGLIGDCLPEKAETGIAKRAALLAAAVVVIALCVLYAVPAAQSIAARAEDEYEINAFADLDDYASWYPEYLIIYDLTFAADTRMFPELPEDAEAPPTNVLFWGGWPTHSDEYNRRLEAFGIDPKSVDVSIFLREDVRLARGVADGEPTELYEYLCEKTGQDVWMSVDMDWGGVHTMVFEGEE